MKDGRQAIRYKLDFLENFLLPIPRALSLLAFYFMDAEVQGLKDFEPRDRPPVMLTFISFRAMGGTIMENRYNGLARLCGLCTRLTSLPIFNPKGSFGPIDLERTFFPLTEIDLRPLIEKDRPIDMPQEENHEQSQRPSFVCELHR